jgi:hypothetical protein
MALGTCESLVPRVTTNELPRPHHENSGMNQECKSRYNIDGNEVGKRLMMVGLAHTRDDLKSGPWLLRIYYIRLSEFLLAQFEDAKRKSYIRVRSFHSGPNQTETPHTTRAFTDLPPRKNFSPTNTNMKLLTILLILAFGSSLAAASSCGHMRNVMPCSHRPPRTAADKDAHTVQYYFW